MDKKESVNLRQINVKQPQNPDEALREVERALYLCAVGYVQKEEKNIIEEDEKGVRRKKREVTVRQVPPDAKCIMSWLKGRQPERWQEEEEGRAACIQVISEAPRPPKEGENDDTA